MVSICIPFRLVVYMRHLFVFSVGCILLPACVALPDFYHSTDQIHKELQDLTYNCPGAQLRFHDATGPDAPLDILEVRSKLAPPFESRAPFTPHFGKKADPGQSKYMEDIQRIQDDAANVERPSVMMVFGEHPRELIASESGLRFVQELCSGSNEAASEALKRSDLRLIVNANPTGRKVVEGGDTCWRGNANGVDINRNFDGGWIHGAIGDPHAFGGDTPFSEPETRQLRASIQENKPRAYVSIHSGGYDLLYPYGYDRPQNSSAPEPDADAMSSLLQPISNAHCDGCPAGPLQQVLGYTAPGNDMDYAFAQGVPYAFTFEIFAGQKAHSYEPRPSFLGLQQPLQQSEDGCFKDLNPTDKEEYEDVLSRWTPAYVDLLAKLPH